MITNKDIVIRFWQLFDQAKFGEAENLMSSSAIIWWPNTREVFRSRDRFIMVNQKYPGRWRIFVEKVISKEDLVISVVRVESSETVESYYANSFFKFEDGKINEIIEYWSENAEPPAWRTEGDFAERY